MRVGAHHVCTIHSVCTIFSLEREERWGGEEIVGGRQGRRKITTFASCIAKIVNSRCVLCI